jgi:uncharacterized membrane protein YgdD (TMEM256/DUF423 family)
MTHCSFVLIAAVLGFLGVALGAFGTHGLRAIFEANGRADTFETATQYHMYHALALLAVAWVESRSPSRSIRWAGYLFILGVVLFSGSLYVLAIFDLGFMGAVAPLGGASLLAAWALLGWSAWRT